MTASRALGWVPVIAHLPTGCLGQSFCEVVETGGGPVLCGQVQHLQGGSVPGEADWKGRNPGQLRAGTHLAYLPENLSCDQPKPVAQTLPGTGEHHRTPTLSTSREVPPFGFARLSLILTVARVTRCPGDNLHFDLCPGIIINSSLYV